MNAKEQQPIEMWLEVVPNSRKFGIMGFNPWTNSLRVKLASKAQKGMANKEIIESFEKLFHAKTRIVSGEKSRKKKISITGISQKEIQKLCLQSPNT